MEEIKKLIKESDLPPIRKNMAVAFVEKAIAHNEAQRSICEIIEKTTKSDFNVVIATDEFIIYTVVGGDEWDEIFPYRVLCFVDGEWSEISEVHEKLDHALLGYLGFKYDKASSSQFLKFARRMLGI